jgi:hypothetical protein
VQPLRFVYWALRLLRDIIWMGISNRSIGLSLAILFLLVVGAVAIGAKLAAPFIYTLF